MKGCQQLLHDIPYCGESVTTDGSPNLAVKKPGLSNKMQDTTHTSHNWEVWGFHVIYQEVLFFSTNHVAGAVVKLADFIRV
jgi:hypothetical protein